MVELIKEIKLQDIETIDKNGFRLIESGSTHQIQIITAHTMIFIQLFNPAQKYGQKQKTLWP
jgi:hypothetical protein